MGQRARGSLGQDSQVRRGLKLCEQCPLGGCQSHEAANVTEGWVNREGRAGAASHGEPGDLGWYTGNGFKPFNRELF